MDLCDRSFRHGEAVKSSSAQGLKQPSAKSIYGRLIRLANFWERRISGTEVHETTAWESRKKRDVERRERLCLRRSEGGWSLVVPWGALSPLCPSATTLQKCIACYRSLPAAAMILIQDAAVVTASALRSLRPAYARSVQANPDVTYASFAGGQIASTSMYVAIPNDWKDCSPAATLTRRR